MDRLFEAHRGAIGANNWELVNAIQAEIAARDDERRRVLGAQPYLSAEIRAELERATK
jgi:hypothetical protein